MRHTKGEWAIDWSDQIRVWVCDDNGDDLAEIMQNDNCNRTNQEANAKLISAAPEMFEALKDAIQELHRLNGSTQAIIRGEKAIKKATE